MPTVSYSVRSWAIMAEGGSEIGVDPKLVVRTNDKTGETFTFFFGKDCTFSQWHSCEFKVDDVEYNCAEQYMMHQKAGKKTSDMLICPYCFLKRFTVDISSFHLVRSRGAKRGSRPPRFLV